MVDLDFKRIEEKWRKFWEEEKIYKFNPETKKEIYSIDTPPPTVSGKIPISVTHFLILSLILLQDTRE